MTVDFDTRKLVGDAIHNMNVIQATSTVQFDIWNLDITRVYNATDSTDLTFTIEQPNPLIGSVLKIDLPRTVSPQETVDIGITYSTSPTGQAFSWLNAE